MTTNQTVYEAETPLPPLTELRMGPLTVGYENGFFRYFRWADHEILRMVYFAIRDENWGTWPPILSNEQWTVDPDRFRVSYTCHYEQDGTTFFVWDVVAEGTASGEFSMTIDGVAHQPFLKNRAGFCILHPILGTAGQPCELIHPDGKVEVSHFPQIIDPENPFKLLAGMRWLHAGRYWFKLEMSGDIFETEDQRNWTDASFKTFCTPHNLPVPVLLQKGEEVHQRILFRPEQPLPSRPESNFNDIVIQVVDEQRTALPALGVSASTETNTLSEPFVQAVQSCSFDHYRIDVSPRQADWETTFLLNVATAQTLGWPLLVALQLSANYTAELRAFLNTVQQSQLVVSDLLVLSADEVVSNADMLRLALNTVRHELPHTRVGAGTNYNFTELNRNRISTEGLDFISYAVHPQAHAFDKRSIVETVDGQGNTVQTARSFSGASAVYVSSVTLRQRLNPDARDPANRILSNAQKTDARQPSRWLAGWTLGSIKYLAEAGAGAITYYQTVGQQGIVSEAAERYPVAVLLAEILVFRGGQVMHTKTNNPLACSTLLLVQGERRRWLITNHTDHPLPVQLPEPFQKGYRITPVPSEKLPLDLAHGDKHWIEPFGTWILDC
ncbi:hypothetical protein EXU85_25350 [Spirosoma sp. KCTC 42546]|uniref:hypothetical protein n=1 Tax=Spirosoma sp. KCTC 42546 TaxID=2520506 RepID=UPI001159422B|nr:hypothetical protein [Spirosoma sp. KCTC 42546]QDK81755.1 hypothetical protein EXU85_25350 [Spirosoma sp. KCTC 42546]